MTKIPKNYKGDIFLEITSRSFNIKFTEGDMLNQMRLVNITNNFLDDKELKNIHKKNPLIFSRKKNVIENGLKVSADLSSDNKICAYESKKVSPYIDFKKINFYDIYKYWKPLKPKNKTLVIEKEP